MVDRLPLEWYVGKLERSEPFTSLLYGDGEFRVMLGGVKSGDEYTNYRERVDLRLANELQDSLLAEGIIRGTDPNLIDYHRYQGGDRAGIWALGSNIEAWLKLFCYPAIQPIQWVDGVVWDVASREGKLGPLFRVLRSRATVLVCNVHVCGAVMPLLGSNKGYVSVPLKNAWGEIDTIARCCVGVELVDPVYVLCMGLGAIPLAMRIKQERPAATVLDLGSALDVFAGIGEERGWRGELYADPTKHRQTVAAHLEGL